MEFTGQFSFIFASNMAAKLSFRSNLHAKLTAVFRPEMRVFAKFVIAFLNAVRPSIHSIISVKNFGSCSSA